MLYRVLKRSIERGDYDKDDMIGKLGVFRDANRISLAEYNELLELVQAT